LLSLNFMTSLLTIPAQSESPESGMAFDEALFLHVISENKLDPIIRFYEFKQPSITIGFGQRKLEFENLNGNASWTRRPTGGGLVAHEHDLIVCFIAPLALHPEFSSPKRSYAIIHKLIQNALKRFQIDTDFHISCRNEDYNPDPMVCFKRPICDDLMFRGTKVAGGAQKRSQGYLLHQESIQLGSLEKLGFLIEKTEFQKVLVLEFEQFFEWKISERMIPEDVLRVASDLTENKYKQPEWKLKGRLDSLQMVS